MTTINVSQPAGGRAVFTRRGPGAGGLVSGATSIPGSVELPILGADEYFQVTLRTGSGSAWSETFAVLPPGDGTYDLEDEDALPRLPLGEAAAGGFALAGRVADLEAAAGEWGALSQRVDSQEDELGGLTEKVESQAVTGGRSTGAISRASAIPDATIAGGFTIERRGSMVLLSIAAVTFGSGQLTYNGVAQPGFRPSAHVYEYMSNDQGQQDPRVVQVLTSGALRIYPGPSAPLRGVMVWMTNDPWPEET